MFVDFCIYRQIGKKAKFLTSCVRIKLKKSILLCLIILFFSPFFLYADKTLNQAPIPQGREEKLLGNAITTIPKAGTNYLSDLMQELKIGVPVAHFFLETEEYWSNFGYLYPSLMHKSEDFVGKTILGIRDLHDVMVSFVFWLDKVFIDLLQNSAHDYDQKTLEDFQEFLDAPFDIKLLKIIEIDGVVCNQMLATKSAIELIIELLKKPKESIFVIRFEDFIGIEAGGYLQDSERFKLFSDMCLFLGYKRSSQEVEKAVGKIFGKSRTYNPVKAKVGRWKEAFDERHIEAFQKNWEELNRHLGYENND